MKPLAIYILLMLNNMPAFAQSKKVISIEWKTIAELPPFNNQSKSIGVAGPIVGVINNKLFESDQNTIHRILVATKIRCIVI